MGRQNGFTLVELLVVVSIIGILITAALLVLDPVAQFQKGNDAKRKEDLKQVQKALETHYNDFGKYPASDPNYKIIWNGSPVDWGSPWTPYISFLPKDPRTQRTFVYYSSPSNSPQSYWIYAAFERSNDPQICKSETSGRSSPCKSYNDNGIPAGACGSGVVCNFGVSSSNTSP